MDRSRVALLVLLAVLLVVPLVLDHGRPGGGSRMSGEEGRSQKVTCSLQGTIESDEREETP